MPLYTRESNRLPATSRASPRRDSANEFDQCDAEPYILNSFGDTLQTVDDLWRPSFTPKTSIPIPSANMRSRPDSGVLPAVEMEASPPSYSERPPQSQTSQVNGVSASPKGILRAERGESRVTQSPTEWTSESGGSTFSRTSIDSTETSVKISRRARPARKPLPPSKRSSTSSVPTMGNKATKPDAVDSDSSRSVSAQQPRNPPLLDSRDPMPTSTSSTIPSRGHTQTLREKFERGIPDARTSQEEHTSSRPTTAVAPSVRVRSHSRDKSNTALNILNSFPTAQTNNKKSMDSSRESPRSSAQPPPSPPAVPLHTDDVWTSMAVPPLTLAHYQCYHSHRTMQLSRNVHASVPCMTCFSEDKEPRWKCSWCCLRICRHCLDLLENSRERAVSDILCNLRDEAAYRKVGVAQ